MTTQVDQGHNPALQEKYYEQIKLLPRNPSKKPNREQNWWISVSPYFPTLKKVLENN